MPLLPRLGTDRDWERLAREDPFWAVASAERFQKENLNEETQREFFDSASHIANLIRTISTRHRARDSPTLLRVSAG
jgi:hypothetical protein